MAMRIAAVEKRLDNLKTKVVSQQELTDVQDVIKPILAQLLKTVKNVEERSNDLDKSMRKRMADVETTLGMLFFFFFRAHALTTRRVAGLSSPPPSSFTEPYVEWTVARMTRSMMRMALAPILFPVRTFIVFFVFFLRRSAEGSNDGNNPPSAHQTDIQFTDQSPAR